MVSCPICGKPVKESNINRHIDSECVEFIESTSSPTTQQIGTDRKALPVASFFRTPSSKITPRTQSPETLSRSEPSRSQANVNSNGVGVTPSTAKRSFDDDQRSDNPDIWPDNGGEPSAKRPKISNLQKAAPLAERMRPRTLDDVYGQELVGPNGVLRGLIEDNRVPSMILWGGAGTGKTTIARLIANLVGSRFVEINSTSSGVAECKKIFTEARSELSLTGRKTILVGDITSYSCITC